jgi:hypothetical protein
MSFTVLIGLVLVISTLVSMWIIDKVGRRSLLIFGSAGMAIALGSIGLLFRASETQTTLLLICILAYVAIFAVSYGTVAYVIIAEIFPIHVRGIAVSIATFALWEETPISRYFRFWWKILARQIPSLSFRYIHHRFIFCPERCLKPKGKRWRKLKPNYIENNHQAPSG